MTRLIFLTTGEIPHTQLGLTQNGTKVWVIHELPLRNNMGFNHILRKSYQYTNMLKRVPIPKDEIIFLWSSLNN